MSKSGYSSKQKLRKGKEKRKQKYERIHNIRTHAPPEPQHRAILDHDVGARNQDELKAWSRYLPYYHWTGCGDTLQHWLYTYSDQSGEPENRSGGDRVERTPMTERVGGIPLPNQIRAETPGMHQTKPHPRSSPCASKRRRCRDARSVQDEDRGHGRLRIDRNNYLEVQDGPGSQRSRQTDRQRRK